MRRVLVIGALTSIVWIVTFMLVKASTAPPVVECRDTHVIVVAAACAAPGPRAFPALPVATGAAGLVVVVAVAVRRRRRDVGDTSSTLADTARG